MFLDDVGYKPSTQCERPQKELHHEYKNFCAEDGYRAVSSRKFSTRLNALGYETTKRNIGKVVFIEK